MRSTIISFSLIILATLILFRVGEHLYLLGNISIELLIAICSLAFLALGFSLSKRAQGSRTDQLENENNSRQESESLKSPDELGITEREMEVLLSIAKGLSNKEIAEHLYLSESTVKTHVSSLLQKLGAKRRTQALIIAKDLNIIT